MTEIMYLKKQIRRKEQKIQAKKALISQHYQALKNKISSPGALLTAFLLGFILTYRYADKKTDLSHLTKHLLTAKNLFLLLA